MSVYTVLISGELGAGKTTTVDALLPELRRRAPDDVHVAAGNFADELKHECARRARVDVALFYTQAGKETHLESVGMTAGRLMQQVGDEERRRDPHVWISALRRRKQDELAASGKATMLLIVGDCRLPDEIDLMRPGFAVRLEGDPGGVRAASTRDLNHATETALRAYESFDIRFDTDVTRTPAIVADIVECLASRVPLK